MKENKVYLLLGSNIGNSVKHLEQARKQIAEKIGSIVRCSSIYSTKAWGKRDQPDFLNQVLVVFSKLTPPETMEAILKIEAKMGRVRTKKNEPRIIDIDILFFQKEIINLKTLTIPHPLIQERNFVLTPLNEIAPMFKHPVLKKTVHELYLNCKDRLMVKKN